MASMTTAASVIACIARFMVFSFCEVWSSPECISDLGESLWVKKDSAPEACAARIYKFLLGGRYGAIPPGLRRNASGSSHSRFGPRLVAE
jgi:hypothetical protein